MGRGRAKAKQTKVARELKYSSPRPTSSGFSASCPGRAPTNPTPWAVTTRGKTTTGAASSLIQTVPMLLRIGTMLCESSL